MYIPRLMNSTTVSTGYGQNTETVGVPVFGTETRRGGIDDDDDGMDFIIVSTSQRED